MANKASTSIDDLTRIVAQSSGNKKSLDELIKALHKIIPVHKPRRETMPDKNLNRIFRIKRVNYSVIAKVTNLNENMYTANVISVEGESFIKAGDNLPISKREFELTARPTASKE